MFTEDDSNINESVRYIDRTLTNALVQHWVSEADQAQELAPNVPLATLAFEGFELACFVEHYWEPHQELGLPGLKEYVRAQFTESIASEIRELSIAVAELQGRYNAEVDPPLVAPVERAEAILSELRRALSFLFDDGVDTIEDGELAQIKQSFGQKSSHDALALSLEGTAYYAHRHRERLKALPRFDDSIIDEALVVGRRMRAQSGLKLRAEPGRKALRAERARVTRLLYERMNIARRTIRYAFAEHPHVLRRATSRYRRERRQQQRERSASAKQAPSA